MTSTGIYECQQVHDVVVGEERFFLVDCTPILDTNQSQVVNTVAVTEVTTTVFSAMTLTGAKNASAITINGRSVAANRAVTISDSAARMDFASIATGAYVLQLAIVTASPIEHLLLTVRINVIAAPS